MSTGYSAMQALWSSLLGPFDLDTHAPQRLLLNDPPPLFPSSFHVSQAAQASIAMASLAATELGVLRGGPTQDISVDKQDAERECAAYFKLDGQTPDAWEQFSGLYATADGFVRIHANFDHHRDGALSLLGFNDATAVDRNMVANALQSWSAEDYETAAAHAGLVVAKVRSFDQWDQHPHARASTDSAVVSITKIGDAPPMELPELDDGQRPLHKLKVTELTRILAGPICGRTLAAYGADVMLVNAPHLPNIANITDTSRGKRSAQIDLRTAHGRHLLEALVGQSQIFVQGYRPDAIAGLGFDPDRLAQLRPGIIVTSLSAYGQHGPWRHRRGFDSLVQTVSGFNHAEAQAAGSDLPKTLPLPILDYASGFLMAFASTAALAMQLREGGSWHVQVSLLQTANWLRSLGRVADAFQSDLPRPNLKTHLAPFPCTHGKLLAFPHAARFSHTPAAFHRPSALPGENAPTW